MAKGDVFNAISALETKPNQTISYASVRGEIMNHMKKSTSFKQAMECARALSNQKLVRSREAAAILSINRKHLYALAARPDFPERIRVSDRVVTWRVADLKAWIDAWAQGGV